MVYITDKLGYHYLISRNAARELRKIHKEIVDLKNKLAELLERKAEIEASIEK